MKFAMKFRRGVLIAAGSLLLNVTGAAAASPNDTSGQQAPPDFGVIQFGDEEAFVDLPVPLADAWHTTLEVVAGFFPAVKADLPYMENNGRIITDDLWVAVETQGVALHSWVHIRVGTPAVLGDAGRTRAEILLDAIADRLEPQKPAAAPQAPPLPAAVEGIADTTVVNNYNTYYYDGAPYSYVQPVYAPVAYSPWYYGSYDPWCNSWNSGFSLTWYHGWKWSLWAGYGSGCGSWGYGNPWWGCSPWWGWNGCSSWNGGWNNGYGTTIVINDFDGSGPFVKAGVLAPRLTGINMPADAKGPLAKGGIAAPRLREINADALPHATNRPTRRAPEPQRPLVVKAERTPGVVVTGQTRPWSEAPVALPETSRPRVVTTASTTAPTRTSTSPSRSSHRETPKVQPLGSAPYSARVPVVVGQRSTPTVTTASGSQPASVPSSGAGDRSKPSASGGATAANNPYTPASHDSRSSSPGQAHSSGNASSASHGSSSSRAPAPTVSAPRPAPAPAPAPRADPPRVSAPAASRPAPAPSSGGSHGSSKPSGGGSSGGSHGKPR